ncbi:acetylornithine deacetylase [Legionella lytica]|uniref:Acetylornithine deacetylase n=1 Tax=Legionella lytica TaxID=96232 RepID=A0ABW8DDW8_9GAMM
MTTLEWLTKLIAFDTTSRNSNIPLIDYVANAFNELHLEPILIHDAKEPKANLLATLPGKNGCREGGIVLSGHTDVVPVDGQDWATDPFKATVIGDKVYGRGACDMKGFIAVVMALIPKLKAQNFLFPIHFAFSYDEEVGCLGAPHLIDKMRALNYQPKACIVGEPTLMLPVIGHKGIRVYRCQVHGVAAHSSLTAQGCNAIEHAASLISYLRSIAQRFKSTGAKDHAYDVPYTTVTTNLVKGGNAYNTIPGLCEFVFEFRNLAQDNPDVLHNTILAYVAEQLEPAMREEQSQAKVVVDTIANAPGLDTSPTEALVRAAQAVSNRSEILKVAYATEAGLFQQAQIPTIVCGPGSIEQAHRADEFVALAQLEQCERFILDMLHASFLGN